MNVQHFFDPDTFTLTYVVYDEGTKDAVIIDPVLDFDPPSGAVSDKSAQVLMAFINDHQLKPHFILETHAHADHLSSSQYLKEKFPGALIAITRRIIPVQTTFKKIFNLKDFHDDGRDFDLLVDDYQEIKAGTLTVKFIPTPGHTPACTTFEINQTLFTGDALFMPDYGTGRCDFPGGDARQLYDSVQIIYAYPDHYQIFTGHDYQPQGRELKFKTTVGESKKENIHIKAETTKEEYVTFRTCRDKTLKAPRLLLPSLQVNIAAGHLPIPEDNQVSYLKLPMKVSY